MESTTAALLDFDQALQAFRTRVVPLLEIGAAQTWDGCQFKAREARFCLGMAGSILANAHQSTGSPVQRSLSFQNGHWGQVLPVG